MNKTKFTACEELVVNQETIRLLKERNVALKPKAVLELRKRGLSYDSIVKLLSVSKVNAIKWVKSAVPTGEKE